MHLPSVLLWACPFLFCTERDDTAEEEALWLALRHRERVTMVGKVVADMMWYEDVKNTRYYK